MTHRPETMTDQQRFAAWVCDHGSAVRGFLLGMVRDAGRADELTQEVFCRAWQARQRYQETGAARGYLMRIADRLACDTARGRQPVVHLDDSGWRQVEPASRDAGPEAMAMRAEQAALLAAALDALSDVQRRVVLLRYFGQMSFAEIAAALAAPLNTVLSHCHRGLQTLRTILSSDDDERGSRETVAEPGSRDRG